MPDLLSNVLLQRRMTDQPYDEEGLNTYAQSHPVPPNMMRNGFDGLVDLLKGATMPSPAADPLYMGYGEKPPASTMEKVGGFLGTATMAAPLIGAAMKGTQKLEPFLIQMYKQRLASDPALAYHPGLHKVPEFMEAFKQLNPGKKILGPGEEMKTTATSILRKTPLGASVASPDEVIDVAKVAASKERKPARMATYGDMKASQGKHQYSEGPPSKYSPEEVQKMVEARATSPLSTKALAEKLGISISTLRDILERTAPK